MPSVRLEVSAQGGHMLKPTAAQAATASLLKAQGFKVEQQCDKTIRMVKGNDYRIVQQDGQQKRAIGVRR